MPSKVGFDFIGRSVIGRSKWQACLAHLRSSSAPFQPIVQAFNRGGRFGLAISFRLLEELGQKRIVVEDESGSGRVCPASFCGYSSVHFRMNQATG